MTAQDLVRIRRWREKQRQRKLELDVLMGDKLLEATRAPHWTFTEAYQLLEISKPTAERLRRLAEEREGEA